MPSSIRLRARWFAALLVLAAASTAAAQTPTTPKSNTTGLLLNFSLHGGAIDSDDLESEPSSGGGFGAQIGWGFTPRFTLLAGASGARLGADDDEGDDFVLVHFDLLARLNFRSGAHAFVPYIEGGFSGRVAGQDDAVVTGTGNPQTVNLEISGAAFTLGGGFHYFVSPIVALGGSLQFSTGEFSTVKFNNVSIEDGIELDATSTRLNVGITLYPMRRR